MIHPHTELRFIRPEIGYGVVATKRIPKGTITWAMDKLDRVWDPPEVNRLETVYQDILETYTFRDREGRFVLCWDHGRFVNHSFHPSSITTAYDFELAVRDILPGEEVTNDYGTLNLTQTFPCIKEKGSRRIIVQPDDFLRYYRRWDRQVASAFKNFSGVEQPLLKFLTPEVEETARAIASGKLKMESILSCYCSPARVKERVL